MTTLRHLAFTAATLLLTSNALAHSEFEDQPVLDPAATEDNPVGSPEPLPWDLAPFLSAFPDGVVRVRGQLDAGDVDAFAVELAVGQTILGALFEPNGGERTDTLLGLFAPGAGTATLTDDDNGRGFLSRLALEVTSPGAWTIAVTGFGDTAFDGSHAEGDGGLVPYELLIAVVDGTSADEVETNDTPGTANPLGVGGGVRRGALAADDVDHFGLPAEVGDRIVSVVVDLASAGLTPLGGEINDPIAGSFSPAASLVSSDDDSGPALLPHDATDVALGGEWTVAVSAFGDPNFTGAHTAAAFDYALVAGRFRGCANPPSLIASITPPASGNAYVAADLIEGDHYYTDRTTPGQHNLTGIPDAMDCAQWIRTPNNDKNVTESNHLVIALGADAVVYVGFDSRATSAPDWLVAGWSDTGLILDVADTDPTQEFTVWKSVRPAGSLTFGGNKAPGSAGTGSNYTLVFQPFSAVSPDGLMTLAGVATGGSVSVEIAGITVTAPTTGGESAADVIAALAAAIHENTALARLGISAAAVGVTLEVDAIIMSMTISDPGLGLGPSIPIFPYTR